MSDQEQDVSRRASAPTRTGRLELPVSLPRLELGLAAAVFVVGLAGALSLLGRDPWLDEFWTLASSERGMTVAEFFAVMARDVHPILHYGLIYVAQAAGVTDIPALRALNLLGLVFMAWAVWIAWRRQALTQRQIVVLVALYASSAMFIGYLAELRAYFMVHSLSIAVVVLWRALARDVANGRKWDLGILVAWGVCLAVFVNLHYFATLLGGLLTLALLVLRRGRGVIALALVSAAAAAPAVAMALVHSVNADLDIVYWVQTGRIDAIFVVVDTVWMAAAFNVIAVGCAVAAALMVLERPPSQALELIDEIVLAAVICAYFAILVVINMARPVIVDRYLIASAGPIVVAVALLAGGRGTPAWAPAAACVFALLAQARGLYSDSYGRAGWTASASFVADAVAACPDARVYIDPSGEVAPAAMLSTVRRYGLRHYADRLGVPYEEAEPGDVIAPAGACPSLVWLEHVLTTGVVTEEELLGRLQLRVEGEAEIVRAGGGLVIVVR